MTQPKVTPNHPREHRSHSTDLPDDDPAPSPLDIARRVLCDRIPIASAFRVCPDAHPATRSIGSRA